MTTAYVCVLSAFMHIHDSKIISDEDGTVLDAMLLGQWNQIYSPEHSLSFKCDSMHQPLQCYVKDMYIRGFIDLYHDLITSFHYAHDMLKDSEQHEKT